ncbi:energy coupling factor transporter S component ThiW [Lactobacillus sp. Sy-1]|uniref:energy coupling factor transporter S component ThiW n=1 Tax=Lactobacillus sp. Sy-1 TaxID=2109645 RepID=UPI001C5B310B|nr:energy coupling factor transporter S component ThiW [Lactobacillus sp. Sy-1]MBW1606219.1 energy coupling factor transporter S component ThiW [Lactobacillus sp. Sy-1]
MGQQKRIQKVTILAIMIALDFVLSPIFRIEGMAPMSSVLNVTAAVMMGPWYATAMAVVCALMRMLFLGIPPLAFTGAVFGALLAGLLYLYKRNVWMAIIGEVIGTGLIGSLASYPVMVWYTGTHSQLFWFVFTPRFFGGAISGSIIAYLILLRLVKTNQFKRIQSFFFNN